MSAVVEIPLNVNHGAGRVVLVDAEDAERDREVKTWKKCQHPRTPENTTNVSAGNPGGQCRTCKQARERVYARRRHATNPEKARARGRRWYAANPEKERLRAANYRAANPERIRAYSQQHYAATAEQQIASVQAWRATNPEKYLEGRRETNWRRQGVLNRHGQRFTFADYQEQFEHQEGRCLLCGRPASVLVPDHFHGPENKGVMRALVCQPCNTIEGLMLKHGINPTDFAMRLHLLRMVPAVVAATKTVEPNNNSAA